jgi:hypothetical protein
MADGWRWLGAEEWDRVVEASPGATGFHSRGWVEALAAWDRRFEPRCLGLELDDGELAALPMLARVGWLRRGLLARAVSTHPSVYGGPVCGSRRLTAADWRRVLGTLRDVPLGRLECFGNPLQPPPGELGGLRRRDVTTHVLDLAALPPRASDHYKNGCRYQVRQAARLGVRVARAGGPGELREYFDVYADSLRRWGKPPGGGYPLALFERLAAAPAVELWVARASDGRLAAGGLFLFARRHAVHWQGAMLEELARTRAATALQDALIEEARRRGRELYDFNPSGELAGVRAFKESFGARALAVPTWRHRHPWLTALARG